MKKTRVTKNMLMVITVENYDVAIIGTGPAGLMAGVYAARYKLKTTIFGEVYGGTISEAHKVENFPAFTSIPGYELAHKMVEQVENNGVKIKQEKVLSVKKNKNNFELKTTDGEYFAKKLIIAIGRKRKLLGVPREKELKGKGISYCAVCDGPFFKDKIVGVVGGSDAALSSAVLLADIAKKVFIIYRKDKFFRAEPVWVELVEKNKKIHSVFNSNIVEFIGREMLTGVKLDTKKTIELDGLFIEIGSEPETEFLQSMGIKLDLSGHIIVDKKMHTSVHGIFSAGDLNADNFKQAVVATSEGAIAANSAYEEIKRESLNK